MNNYSVESKKYKELKDITSLPKYQRKLVWSKSQKEKFIESIREGFPFGSLLVYKYENKEDKDRDKLSIIDGLQRFSTLKEFERAKHEYYPIEEKIESLFSKDVENLSKSASQEILMNYKKIILSGINDTAGKTDFSIASELKNLHKTEFELETYYDRYMELRQEINEYIDLDNLEIPYVYFKGNVSDLAEVFQRLNQGGVKLSKYQVFASQWVEFEIELNTEEINTQILEININRYNNLNESREGIVIEDYDENDFRSERKVNLAELCYALGKLILIKSDCLYSEDANNEDLANELGYATMAIVLGVENNKLADISKSEQYINAEDIEEIFKRILKVYSDINLELKQYLQLPTKKSKPIYFNKNITNFMNLSYFASLWCIKYISNDKFNLEEKGKTKQQYEIAKSNIIYYYIYDTVTNYWSATGDKKLNEIYASASPRDRYLEKISQTTFEQQLMFWSEEEIKKSSVNINNTVKLITVVFNNLEDKGLKCNGINNADFEHIYVRKFINKAKNNSDYLIPGGHLGNVCLLTEYENRKKKENTLYFTKEKHSTFNLDDEYLDLISYPIHEEITFVDTMDISEQNLEVMNDTINKRAKIIINSLIHKLY